MTDEDFFKELAIDFFEAKDATIAYRKVGHGAKLLFIHGFPTYGYTWRKLLPDLSKSFECYVADLPGLGLSKWDDNTNFDIYNQANRLLEFCYYLKFEKVKIIAHDSGASIARIMSIVAPDFVTDLVMFNTEIPNHRPPWIPLYQKLSNYSFMNPVFRLLIKSKLFRNSSLGFKEFYTNKALLDDDNYVIPYIKPFIESKQKTTGALRYLKGINWKAIDDFKFSHQSITANILFVWGQNDITFPLQELEKILQQFKCKNRVEVIKDASLLVHEEKSKEVNKILKQFLKTI